VTLDTTPVVDVDPALPEVERRVLWLATAIVHHANRRRADTSGVKVGGHQASSASMVTIMTTLWFHQLTEHDRISVKPHASPVLHAINYLLGELEPSYLTTLRSFGGLQSYPSRAKDPDPVDYSTGSVGIGATSTIWGALARRYVDGHFAHAHRGRQYALLGDAELDEGACWEAIMDPAVAGLGELVWIVDLNRQSLDRIVPNLNADRLEGMFAAAGWQALTVKYGTILQKLFEQPDGDALRQRIDQMENAEYQRLLRCNPQELRQRLPGPTERGERIARLLARFDDDTMCAAIRNLGGHDMQSLRAAYADIDDTRPTVILAYTIKGYGLPTEGHPRNHSSLLSDKQFAELARRLDADIDQPWGTFPVDSTPARLCAATSSRLRRAPQAPSGPPSLPTDFGRTPTGTVTTQAALGRALLDLTREAPDAARRVVTVSPDVTSSTNLAGWLNKVGVWSPEEHRDWFADDTESPLHWHERPTGQHIELGIAETNLVGLIAELGSTWSRWAEPLFPIGVLYDSFVQRALEPWSFGIYAGGQSILVGTPSGVSLASEGGAHQSVTTPSSGLEQPGCTSYEPGFALDTEWCLLAGLAQLGRPNGSSTYLRLSTRPIDQTLAAVPTDTPARERRRQQVVAGGYRLRRSDRPNVTIAVTGALVPEALRAAEQLSDRGHHPDVVCITSADLLFRAIQARNGQQPGPSWILQRLFPEDRATPLVTLTDGHPHTMSFLATINRVPSIHLGVTEFGQSGSLEEAYSHHGLHAANVTRACLDLVE